VRGPAVGFIPAGDGPVPRWRPPGRAGVLRPARRCFIWDRPAGLL